MNHSSLDKARRVLRDTETRKTIQERIDRYRDNIKYWDKHPECDADGINRKFAEAMLRIDIIGRKNLRSNADH
jgi:guanylate kinase